MTTATTTRTGLDALRALGARTTVRADQLRGACLAYHRATHAGEEHQALELVGMVLPRPMRSMGITRSDVDAYGREVTARR